MNTKDFMIASRLDLKTAEWFRNRMKDTKKSSAELVREIIVERIELETDPWGFLAKVWKRPTIINPTNAEEVPLDDDGKINMGRNVVTLIPDFQKINQEGEKA